MSILVTGGAGYIGSHTCIELLEAGYQVVVVDNLCNSSKKSLERVQEITGKELTFYQDDLLDSEALDAIFQRESIDAVIHFAGLKAVGESVQKPLEYYHNNLTGTFILLEKMKKYQVKNFVFSSSATVYGSPKSVPIREDFPLHVTNPYGRTKLILEEVLTDVHTADPAFNVILLRYFNPIGAHRSGRIGENPKGIPNNLLPYITQVAIGKLPKINVFGDDYDTPDGTGVRDYIHVVVLDIIHNFEKACGRKLPYEVTARRPGDIAECYADCSKAKKELGWEAQYTLKDMCEDSWRWQKNNPNGYED